MFVKKIGIFPRAMVRSVMKKIGISKKLEWRIMIDLQSRSTETIIVIFLIIPPSSQKSPQWKTDANLQTKLLFTHNRSHNHAEPWQEETCSRSLLHRS